MSPEEWQELVGHRVKAKRGRLSIRKAAARAKISEGLWRQIESGRRPIHKGLYETVNPKPETLAAVSTSLGWTEDSIDRLLAGEEPIDATDPSTIPEPTEGYVPMSLGAVGFAQLAELAQRVDDLMGELREYQESHVESHAQGVAWMADVTTRLERLEARGSGPSRRSNPG